MITREEAYIQIYAFNDELGEHSKILYKLIDIIFDQFEQHIKSLEAQLNTEQFTCDGCIKKKRCVTCKYCKLNDGTGRYECDHNEALWNVGSVFEDTFGCIYHEAKDTQ